MKKIITIAQRKGGVGKTTLTSQLLVAFTKKGYKVAALDIDPQGSLSHWYRLREEKFGKKFTSIEFKNVPGWKVGNEIMKLRLTHDIVIIDSPPHNETDSKAAIRAADLVIIPLQPSPTDLWATMDTIAFAEKERKSYHLVLNRLQHNSKLAKSIIDQLPEKKALKTNIGNRVGFSSCMASGLGVLETEPSGVAAEEIRSLTEEICLLLEHLQPESVMC